MHTSSKVKSLALAAALLAGAPEATCAGNILIESGAGRDTVILVEPGAGQGREAPSMWLESDAENGTFMEVGPHTENAPLPGIAPLIIRPEVHIREK